MKIKISNINNPVIIWGGDHHNTLGVIRSLGERRIYPYVMIIKCDNMRSFVLKSRYVKEGWIFSSDIACCEFILNQFSNSRSKAIIIATSDNAISCIDMNYDRLIQHFYIPNGAGPGRLTRLMDKKIISKLAFESGLTIPKIWCNIDISKLDNIEFPCIVKPLKSITGEKSDISIIEDKAHLEEYLANKNADNYIIEKYIEKRFEFQLIGCSLDGGKEVIIPGYTKIIRAPYYTNTGYLQYILTNEIDRELKLNIELCKHLIEKCMYTGLFSMEFVKGVDNRNYFLEINFRNDGNAYSATASGCNLPFLFVAYFAKRIYWEKYYLPNLHCSITVMPEIPDLIYVISSRLSIIGWIKDFLGADCRLYYDKRDPVPFIFELYSLLFRLSKRLFLWR